MKVRGGELIKLVLVKCRLSKEEYLKLKMER